MKIILYNTTRQGQYRFYLPGGKVPTPAKPEPWLEAHGAEGAPINLGGEYVLYYSQHPGGDWCTFGTHEMPSGLPIGDVAAIVEAVRYISIRARRPAGSLDSSTRQWMQLLQCIHWRFVFTGKVRYYVTCL